MPAFSGTISINDGETTPVAHVFSPSTIAQLNGRETMALWENRAANGGTGIGFEKLSFHYRRPADAAAGVGSVKDRLWKHTIRLSLPALETYSAAAPGVTYPVVAFEDVAVLHIFQPERGSTQRRKNLRVLLLNALQNAAVTTFLEGPEAFN